MGSVFNRGTRDRPLWYVKFRDLDRKWKMIPAHQPDRDRARKLLQQIESNISNGKAGVVEPKLEEVARKRITIKELGDRFLADYSSPRVKDAGNYRKLVGCLFRKHVYPDLGSRRASEVTHVDLGRLRDAKLTASVRDGVTYPGKSKATVKLVLAYLSRMFNWARTEGIIDCPNPVSAVDKPSLAGREMDFDYLSRDEVEALLLWAAEHQPAEHPLYATAVFSGLRLGELDGLRWTDLDLDRGLINVRRSYRAAPKSGKPRHVPINPRLTPILRQWRDRCPASSEGLVFPTVTGTMRNKDADYGFKTALAGAGCHAVRFHGLRHTFASHFIMSGGNILSLQRLLGHSSVAVTQKYAHLAPDYMREEIGRMSFDRAPASVTPIASRQKVATPAAG